ncbi:MAG: glycerophosphodiester phosphodiesterase family protein [Ignavibacteria bacterium]|nr:glycerophosphodiester phosphodiesterase family protein [Ignavibacteria bacterium]
MSENQKKTIIVSHRLRGFDEHDASLKGLQNAIANNITHFEVDCRITKDGEIVIHHDARLGSDFSSNPFIADKTLSELKQIFYKNSNDTVLTLDELFQIIELHQNIKIYLDIKECGKEEKIIEEAAKRNLLKNIVIVSWLPEVLFKINSLLPSMQLCFSFYPVCDTFPSQINYFNAKIKSLLFRQKKDRNTSLFNTYNTDNGVTGQYGFDHEHFVSLPFRGKLLETLQSVNGIACVNYKLPSQHFIEQLQKQNLQICLYSINTKKDLQKYGAKFHPDIVLTDNSTLM